MLKCKDIVLAYRGKRVLNNVSVEVEPGRVTAIIGPSGAGKSSLLRCLAFIDSPASGAVTMDGDEYLASESTTFPLRTPWPEVTAVFQQFFLWPHLTLRKNISLPLELRKVKDIEIRITRLIDQFSMSDFVNRFPNEVSGGQRQRAALARALALEPKYLLMDEITSALDAVQAAAIVNHMTVLKDAGIGILMITHHLGFLRRAADSIVYMQDGEIVEAGGKEILDIPATPELKTFLSAFNSLENSNTPRQGEPR